MHFTSTSAWKATAVYSLLAIAQARSVPIDHHIDERSISLDDRSAPPRFPGGREIVEPPIRGPGGHNILNDAQPPQPAGLRPGQQPHGDAPGGSGPPRVGPGADAPAGGAGERPATLEAKGARDRADLHAKNTGPNKDTNVGYGNYDQKIRDYHVEDPSSEPLFLNIKPQTHAWLKELGVPVDQTVQKHTVWGDRAGEMAADREVYAARVHAESGTLIRDMEYRKGQYEVSGVTKEVDDLYPNIPEADRIQINDHIYKTWDMLGEGKPIQRNLLTEVSNKDLDADIRTLVPNGPDPVKNTIGPNNPLYNKMVGGSIGGPMTASLNKQSGFFKQRETGDLTLINNGAPDHEIYGVLDLPGTAAPAPGAPGPAGK